MFIQMKAVRRGWWLFDDPPLCKGWQKITHLCKGWQKITHLCRGSQEQDSGLLRKPQVARYPANQEHGKVAKKCQWWTNPEMWLTKFQQKSAKTDQYWCDFWERFQLVEHLNSSSLLLCPLGLLQATGKHCLNKKIIIKTIKLFSFLYFDIHLENTHWEKIWNYFGLGFTLK